MDTKKEIIIRNLERCINAFNTYDVNTQIPLLYTLYAIKHGYKIIYSAATGEEVTFNPNFNIQLDKSVSGTDSSFLNELRSLVQNRYFEGGYATTIADFIRDNSEYLDEFYPDMIEFIITSFVSRGGKYSGVAQTPHDVASLMASLVKSLNPQIIFDPCAGLSTYALRPELKETPFVGYEIDKFTWALARILLDAYGKKGDVFNNDALSDWSAASNCDTLVSEPPFGLRLKMDLKDDLCPSLMEDFLIYRFINIPSIRKAVLMVPTGAFTRKESVQLRETVSKNNWLDTVIKLPSGILSYTGIATGIVVLNKDRDNTDVKFILADDCIKSIFRLRSLDVDAVLNRVNGIDDKQSCVVPSKALLEHDFSFDPASYVSESIEVLPGQKIVKFMSLADKIKGERKYDDLKGRVLQPSHMSSSISDSQTRNILVEEQDISSANLVKVCEDCIIFNVAADKFFIKNDRSPLFVSPSYNCFSVKLDKCLPEYLAECVVKAKRFRETAMKGAGMQRVDYDNLLLPIFENIDSQRQIIQRIYRQEQNELKKKLEKLQLLGGKSSDLIHNLGITFTKISASIGIFRNVSDDKTVNNMYDNVQFALRLINSTGSDYLSVKPELEKENIYEVMKGYAQAWKNFGFQTFDILPIRMDMSEDTIVELDRTLFYTMMDCIFINAHQHGFNKRKTPDNKVMVKIDGVEYKGKRYARIAISNNGNPLPDDFTLNDFVSRGVVGINSSQDGIGGDHICKIAHHHGGYLSIENEPDWVTFSILLPVYLTSNETVYTDYEYECV